MVDAVGIAVPAGEREGLGAARRNADDKVDVACLARRQHDAPADGRAGVEGCAGEVGERPEAIERSRCRKRAAATDEASSVALGGERNAVLLMERHEHEGPVGGVVGAGGSPVDEDEAECGQPFRDDEEVAEGRMGAVGCCRCEDELRIGGEAELPGSGGVVGEPEPSHLEVVVGVDRDGGVGGDIVVAAAELGEPLGEDGLCALPRDAGGEEGGGPDLPRLGIGNVGETA